MNVVLLDFSQIVISASIDYSRQTNEPIPLELLRHISLSNIISYKTKFKVSNENMILCYDGRSYWRKNIFPQYKQNRKIEHDKSSFDWDKFFINFNKIKSEIQEDLPFMSIEVDECEADDVICVLSKILCPHYSQIVIVSSDKDLLQIQLNICSNVRQWSPHHRKYIDPVGSSYSLFEHIVRGDSGDGIPNIFSDDDVYTSTERKRSKPIRASALEMWKEKGGMSSPEVFCESPVTLDKLKRNRILIDLREIPSNLVDRISNKYRDYEFKRRDIFQYLISHKLRKILEKGGI